MPNGVIIIDKAAGWTSQDVAAKLRGVMGTRRVGHGGTLDPMATGVLPVFVGRATRAADYAAAQDKDYEAVLRLGIVTDTQDTTGELLERHDAAVTPAELEAALAPFRGEIFQIPPMYSAVKINGQKLYKLARRGIEVERRPRPVTISRLEARPLGGPDFALSVTCSKGTYIRTLCHDIGQALGCGAAMAALRRTRVGAFTLEQAVSVEEASPEKVVPVDRLFAGYPELSLDEAGERVCRCGGVLSVSAADGLYRVYGRDEFLMLGRVSDGRLVTVKNFFEV